jgi:hypothetical protein
MIFFVVQNVEQRAKLLFPGRLGLSHVLGVVALCAGLLMA